jgi:uncharacterized membrane protein
LRPRVPAAHSISIIPGCAGETDGGSAAGALHWTIRGIEIAGIVVIVIGAVAASATYLHRAAREGPSEAQHYRFRSALGRSILLGLGFLVAADIINTVAIDPAQKPSRCWRE